jgi:predicted permease
MRFAARSLSRKPAFFLAAVLTIALGVGANTALFSVIYGVLLEPLPFRDPGRLVEIWETHPALPQLQVTVPDFRDWRSQAASFDQMAAYTLSAMNTVTLLGQGEPEVEHATMAASDLLTMMGMEPLAGRIFTSAEERGKQNVAMISERLWRRKFAGDGQVVGRQIRLDGNSFQVVGILQQRQVFPEWADIWIPLSLIDPALEARRKSHPLEVMARLKPGVTAEQANVEIQNIAHRLAADHPDTNATVGAYVIPLATEMTKTVRPSLLLGWAAVGFILLMACANVAHLFLARMVERRGEIQIRRSLGATPWHLLRDILAEGLLMATVGGAAGFAAVAASGRLMRSFTTIQIPRMEEIRFNAPVLLFAAGISLLCALLFALPACTKAVSGRSFTRVRSRLTGVTMTAEVAIAFLVLTGVALLTRSFVTLLEQDPGFSAQNVWMVPGLPLRGDFVKSAPFLSTQVSPALERVPGVLEVAAANIAPMGLSLTEHSRFATRFGLEGRVFDAGSYPVAQNRWVTPNFFHVLGIPLKRGAWLTGADLNNTRILINETLARRFFAGQDPVGKHLVLGVLDPKQTLYEIAGVVGDVREFGLDQEVDPTIYGIAAGPVMTLLIRTAPGAAPPADRLRAAIHQADGPDACREDRAPGAERFGITGTAPLHAVAARDFGWHGGVFDSGRHLWIASSIGECGREGIGRSRGDRCAASRTGGDDSTRSAIDYGSWIGDRRSAGRRVRKRDEESGVSGFATRSGVAGECGIVFDCAGVAVGGPSGGAGRARGPGGGVAERVIRSNCSSTPHAPLVAGAGRLPGAWLPGR